MASTGRLPNELWIEIALYLPTANSLNALAQSCKHLYQIIQTPQVRSQWILKYSDNNYNDALMFMYKRTMIKELEYLILNRCKYPTADVTDAFARIVCHQTCHLSATIQSNVDKEHELSLQMCKLTAVKCILEKSLHFEQHYQNTNADLPALNYSCTLSLHDMAIMAFRWCLYFGEYYIVAYLIKNYGLKIDTVNCHVNWWLRMLRNKRFDLIVLLLQVGVEIIGANQSGTTESRLAQRAAAASGDSSDFDHSPDDDHIHFQILSTMAQEANIDAIKVILLHTPLFKASQSAFKSAIYSIIIASASHNKTEVLKFLLADMGISLCEYDQGLDGLMMAVAAGSQSYLRFFIQNIQLESYHAELHSLLLLAIEVNKVNIVQELMDLGCDVSYNNQEALKLSCRHGKERVVEILLKSGADVSVDNFRAVEEAASCGSFGIVNLMLAHCEDTKSFPAKNLRWRLMAKFKEVWKSIH